MADKKNIFISHVHEDDAILPQLKELISKAGMEVHDGSINSDKPNKASNEEYIKREILAPRIEWASTLVVLITHDTAQSDWVNWEIKYAIEQGKTWPICKKPITSSPMRTGTAVSLKPKAQLMVWASNRADSDRCCCVCRQLEQARLFWATKAQKSFSWRRP